MEFSIKRRTSPPSPLIELISIQFLPHFFLLQLNHTYIYETYFTLGLSKNITLKSSYNWFKIDIRWLLRPLTAIFSDVYSHLNYYIYVHNIKLKLCAKRVLVVRE